MADEKPTEKGSTFDVGPKGYTNDFTMKIITQDGAGYWELDGHALGKPLVVEPVMKALVAMDIDVAHLPKDHPMIEVCGTFFVNLSVFAKK